MKKMVKRVKLFLVIGLITMPVILMAQDFPPEVEDVPFDGGVSLLVAAGIGYGLKKVYNRKQSEKKNIL